MKDPHPNVGTTTAERTVVPWWQLAFLKAVAGCALGLLTTFLIVLLSKTIFPQISDFGIDAGLRLKVRLDRVSNFSSGLPLQERGSTASMPGASTAFVFLDVDPEHSDNPLSQSEAGSMPACAALAKRFPKEYRVVAAPENERGPEKSRKPELLHCESTRPLNRHLLAKLVEGLRERGARVVVLDIILATERGVIDSQENQALAKVLAETHTPVVYAAPVQLRWQEGEQNERNVVKLESTMLASGLEFNSSLVAKPGTAAQKSFVWAAIAFPAQGEPVRRYPACFWIEGAGTAVSSLPRLVAELVTTPEADRSTLGPCRSLNQDAVPRILYTLPPLTGHQDQIAHPEVRAQWAFYRKVLNRCLASRFWETEGSLCGDVPFGQSVFNDKVVVVGTSNPVRRDWHYTPLGNMVGAEVVINAIRSFQQFPDVRDATLIEALAKKWPIVVCCSVVWFLFHAVRYRTQIGIASSTSLRVRVQRTVLVVGSFIVTLLLVLVLTLWISFKSAGPIPSLDVVLGVLAITIEQYVEAAQWIIRHLERLLARFLGLGEARAH